MQLQKKAIINLSPVSFILLDIIKLAFIHAFFYYILNLETEFQNSYFLGGIFLFNLKNLSHNPMANYLMREVPQTEPQQILLSLTVYILLTNLGSSFGNL